MLSEFASEVELRPARFNERFIAYVIDILPFAAGYALTAPKIQVTVWVAACLVYQWIGNACGGSIGKRLMGLRVVRRDGQRLGLFASLFRAIGYALCAPLFNLGFLVALVHPESRALDDLLSGALVIEARPKPEAESWLLFFCAMVVLIGLYAGMIYGHLGRPLPSDLQAVGRAKRAMLVISQVEEAYKAGHGSYTQSLSDLSVASGDADTFRSSMLEIFMPDAFQLAAGSSGYRISAQARDRRHTRVLLEGPPPRVAAR